MPCKLSLDQIFTLEVFDWLAMLVWALGSGMLRGAGLDMVNGNLHRTGLRQAMRLGNPSQADIASQESPPLQPCDSTQ